MSDGDPTDEVSHELELYAEAALTDFGPVPRIGIKLRRARKIRVEKMVSAAAERAGVATGELGERLADDENEQLRDLFDRALNRAAEVGDENYIDALGRLVGAALDDTQILTADYLTSLLVQLDPVHLRVLVNAFDYVPVPDEDFSLIPLTLTGRSVGDLLGVSASVGEGVLQRLEAAGFLWDATLQKGSPPPDDRLVGGYPAFRSGSKVPPTQPERWKPNAFAEETVAFLYPLIEDVRGRVP